MKMWIEGRKSTKRNLDKERKDTIKGKSRKITEERPSGGKGSREREGERRTPLIAEGTC